MRQLIFVLMILSLMGTISCKKEEGLLEKTGKKLDQAFDDAAEELEEMSDEK